MGNHKKKKGPNKKPQVTPTAEPEPVVEAVTAVEEVQIVAQPIAAVADVSVPNEVSKRVEMSEVESELKKLDLNAEKA